jgi:hypothetical protein
MIFTIVISCQITYFTENYLINNLYFVTYVKYEISIYLYTPTASLACSLSFLNLIAIGKSILVARLNKIKEGQITKIFQWVIVV